MKGYIKIAAAVPVGKIADCAHNVQQIVDMIANASDEGASVIVLPELSVTGYTCGDLFSQPYFIRQAEEALDNILSLTHTMAATAVIGLPLMYQNRVYNCAVVINKGNIQGVVPKTYITKAEVRWFASGSDINNSHITLCGQDVPFGTDILFSADNVTFGIEIGEDLMATIAPSAFLALAGANIILNPSANINIAGSQKALAQQIRQHSIRTTTAYIYCSCGYGESTTDVVYGGSSFIAEHGEILAKGECFKTTDSMICADIDILKLESLRMQRDSFRSMATMPSFRHIQLPLRNDKESLLNSRTYNPLPFVPKDNELAEHCNEILEIQTNGLAQRYTMSYSKCMVLGISGGLDSTLALLVAVGTMDKLGLSRKNIIGITMPGFGTTGRTYNNAIKLMESLGITIKEISIKEACIQHFKDIDLPENDRSVTYENSQARERTQILMDIANKEGGLVVGTGDLSEVALGWATYNGDHMSMYGVNASVPKTLIRHLIREIANSGKYSDSASYLLDIVDTPISPELLPADQAGNIAQKTEDIVGPYELHDFFLYHFVQYGYNPERLFFMAQRAFDNYDKETIKKWLIVFLRRFFNQQFKRSAMPDGPQTTCVGLSPRGGWLMPSDAQSRLWLDEANEIEL